MSTRRKKNSTNPRPVEVTFIKIYENDKNPWPLDYYMCGMCGHAISMKEVETHAKKNHKARSLKLVDVDDAPLPGEELRDVHELGSGVPSGESFVLEQTTNG